MQRLHPERTLIDCEGGATAIRAKRFGFGISSERRELGAGKKDGIVAKCMRDGFESFVSIPLVNHTFT